MGFTRIEDSDLKNKGVIGLPDAPDLPIAELQRKFDELVLDVVVPKVNAIVAELEALTAAQSIGIDVEDELSVNKNLQAAFTRLHSIVKVLKEASHTHENKALLDIITVDVIDQLARLGVLIEELDATIDDVNQKINKSTEDVNAKINETTADVNEKLNECNELLEECEGIARSADESYEKSVEALDEAIEKYESITDIKSIEVEEEQSIKNFSEWDVIDGIPSGKIIAAVAGGSDACVAVCDQSITFISNNGEDWSVITGIPSAVRINDVAYGNGKFVCVCYPYDGCSSYYTDDGETWNPGSGLDESDYFYNIVYGDGVFYSVGELGSIFCSTNGETWELKAVEGDVRPELGSHHRVVYGEGKLLLLNEIGSYDSFIYDGSKWEAIAPNLPEDSYATTAIYGLGRFVIVCSDGNSYYSFDGETWVKMDIELVPGIHVSTAAFCNDMFVCVCEDKQTYYSEDGEKWVCSDASLLPSDYQFPYSTFSDDGNFYCVRNYIREGESSFCMQITTTVEVVKVLKGISEYLSENLCPAVEELQDDVKELHDKSVIIKQTLSAGGTEIVIESTNITENSTLSFYTSIYGVNPTAVTVVNGSVALTFDAQEVDMEVGVRVDG